MPECCWENSAFLAIVELGPPAVPYMIEQVREHGRTYGGALGRITKWRYHVDREEPVTGDYVWHVREFPEIRKDTGPPDYRVVVIHWWDHGRRQTPAKFEEAYREWMALLRKGEVRNRPLWREEVVYYPESVARRKVNTPLGDAYEAMRDLGIDVLPLIVEKLRAGEFSLLPLLAELTDGWAFNGAVAGVPLDAEAQFAIGWWERNKDKWLLPPPEGMGKDWYLQKPEETKADAPDEKKGENKGAGARKDEKAEPKPGAQDTKKQPAPQPEKPK